ncbi:glycosyltransferase [Methylotenera sp. 1P/1]|uniref:glycosyltransferase family 2 protein n=1 Tax=Methylotenera sp. 1P/1 TaxID=1131551 RepID=UPI00037A7727|nr:glycosyltransferase [Methylotenera sp. 1P/1]
MIKDTPALVSVVIVTRDRLVLLQRAVQSILSQVYTQLEIIIVDNTSVNSPDFQAVDTGGIPIQVIRTPSFLTASASRNFGVSQARGEWICFLDDDDYYLPNKIQALVDAFNADASVEMAYGNTQMLGPDQIDLGVCNGPPEILQLMYYRYIHLNAVMIKRSVLQRIAFDETMTTYEDADLMFRIVKDCRCVHVDQVLAVWNRDNRPDQLTTKNWARAEKNWLMLCQKFSTSIQAHQKTAQMYYKKMSVLSFYNWHPLQGIYYGLCYAFFGWLKPSSSKINIQ